MSVVSTISIQTYTVHDVGELLPHFERAGWGFHDGAITTAHYRDIADDWNERSTSSENWQAHQRHLSEFLKRGETIAITYWCQQSDPSATFSFGSPNHLEVFLGGGRVSLPGPCRRFTDFSWYLERILCPLLDAGFTVLEVNCRDGNW